MMNVIVAITGASGAVYGVTLLRRLRELGIDTCLILSDWAKKTIELEVSEKVADVEMLATHVFDDHDLSAPIASGSFRTDCMVIAPCSMKTLSGIAHGYAETLIVRAADVMLKERRKLILITRETPLSLIHIDNMRRATEAGAVVMPPCPAFYNHPQTVSDLVGQTVERILDEVGLYGQSEAKRWRGL